MDQMYLLLQKMMLDDPYLKSMHEGKMQWGDLMIQYERENPKPKKLESERAITPPRTRPAVEEQEAPWAPIKASREPVEDCGICTLRLGNLPRDISPQELKAIFSAHGTVRDVHIPKNMDRSSPYFGTIRGFAMVEFEKSWEATIALTAVYGLTIRAKKITCEFAKSDRKKADQMMSPLTPTPTAAPHAIPRIQRQNVDVVAPLRPYIERQSAHTSSYTYKSRINRTYSPDEILPPHHFRLEDGTIFIF